MPLPDVVVKLFNNIILTIFNFDLQASNPMNHWPMWAVLLTGFLVGDFVQWWVHRLLHRVKFFMEFSQSPPFCSANGICSAPSISLDGKCGLQIY